MAEARPLGGAGAPSATRCDGEARRKTSTRPVREPQASPTSSGRLPDMIPADSLTPTARRYRAPLPLGRDLIQPVRAGRPRMLAVVARFKWVHINYLKALEQHFDVMVAWSGEGEGGSPRTVFARACAACRSARSATSAQRRFARGSQLLSSDWQPDVVHLMYYNHDDLTLMVRELVDQTVTVVYECRDPQTTLSGQSPGRIAGTSSGRRWRQATRRSSSARRCARISSAPTASSCARLRLIVQNGFARHTIAAPSPKLSAGDGRVHIALVGTADDQPDHGRWYVDIIRRLVSAGLVVHSHFFEPPSSIWATLPRAISRIWPENSTTTTFIRRCPTARDGAVGAGLALRPDGRLPRAGGRGITTSPPPSPSACRPRRSAAGCTEASRSSAYPIYRGLVEHIEAHDIGFVIETGRTSGGSPPIVRRSPPRPSAPWPAATSSPANATRSGSRSSSGSSTRRKTEPQDGGWLRRRDRCLTRPCVS